MIKESLVFKEDLIEGKSEYPYLTVFKKDPFRSFVLTRDRDISSFYISKYNELVDFFSYFNKNLLKEKSLNLENVYWFLLLKKYLKMVSKEDNKELYDFIIKCEMRKENKLGFKFSPYSTQREPDIWSTYFALSCMKLLGLLDQYLLSKGHNVVLREIKSFLALHNKGNVYLHCLDKQCEICQKTTSARTIYFTLEILHLLGIDTRLSKDIFRPYLSDKKRDPEIIFKILSLKYLDLDVDVRERTIQYLNQFQKENGGFSFKKIEGRINTTFWVVYALDIYSWLLDYDPISIYPFIISKINVILNKETYRNLLRMMELSKLVILLSIIWRRFIDQIERVIFRNLESDKFVDLNYIISSFGLTYGIEDVISYINKFYTFNLRVLDNHLEFTNHIRDLSPGMKTFLSDIYEKIKKNGIAKLPSVKKDLRKLKSRYSYETFKFKEDILPIVNSMIEKHLFKSIIKKKKKYYLSSFLENIIVSDTEIKTDRLFFEKDKVKDIKNDIFNMILKLKNASLQIKAEIESYLILEEVLLAKERLRYVIRDALMEADFLNENIENSFNEDLYYIDFQNAFESEISRWNELYLILSKKLKNTDSYLSEKIAQKEEFRNLNQTLDNIQDKIFIFNESIDRKLNRFRENLKNIIEEFNEEDFSGIIKEFEIIRTNIGEFDKKLYEISQKIVSKESEVIEKRKQIVDDWIVIKEEYNETINYYSEGFLFFRNSIKKIDNLKHTIVQESQIIHEKAKEKAKEKQFKDAFNIIKSDSDILLKSKTREIKELRANIKIEINSKQKLYLLYKQLLAKIDLLEENLVTDMSLEAKSLKNKVMEERNRAKIEDFDNFISHEIMTFKELISASKESLEQASEINIKNIIDDFDLVQNRFNEKDKEYLKKLNHCRELIENFDDKSNLTIIQWENFKEYLKNEINILKEDYINKVISEKINLIANKKKTNTIKVIDLKKELGLKCGVLMDRIKDMIEISKLNAKLYDAEKCVLLYTPSYYKNKELRNFIDNKLLKIVRERIGKILALYDSSIRNKTLNVNLLELQNRIKELDFKEIARVQFENKVKELDIDQTRSEFIETNKYFNSIIENNILAINNIQINLKLFNDKQNLIIHEFNYLKSLLNEYFSKIVEDIDKKREKSYFKVKTEFGNRWSKIANLYEQAHLRIETDLKSFLSKNKDTKMLSIELGEFFVKKKSIFLDDYEKKKEIINGKILILKDETFRGELIKFINEKKIRISQMLGMLQSRVEDDIEAREYKRATIKIQKRERDIKSQIKITRKSIKTYVREFNKYSIGFGTKNKHILEEFGKFIEDFIATLMEKVKSLEQLIIKSYVNMAIKAVANEFLTIGFLNNELKIKKQNLQEHLIYLISSGNLKGKFDLRLNIYYENPELLEKLNEDELELFKKSSYRTYMFWKKVKSFSSLYGPVIGFFASLLAITYYVFIFTEGNPASFAIPGVFILFLIIYFLFKREKEEKVKA